MGIQINNKQVLDMNYLGKKAYSAVLNGDYVFASTLKKVSGIQTNIKDAAALPINKLYLEGNSYQETTSGKNLFNKNDTSKMLIDHYFYAKDTIKTGSGLKMAYIPCKPNTTYTVSKIVSARFGIGYTNEIPAKGVLVIGGTMANENSSLVTTTSSDAKYLCVFYKHSSDTLTAEEIEDTIQIEEGSTATDYEPYTNGPSPNPDYPQEIEVIEGSVDVEVIGKNVLKNITSYTWRDNGSAAGVNHEIIDDYVKVNLPTENPSQYHGIFCLQLAEPFPEFIGKEVVYSFYAKADEDRKIIIQCIGSGTIYTINLTTEWQRYGFVVPSLNNTQSPTFYSGPTLNTSSFYIKNIMLEEGSRPSDYEPYKKLEHTGKNICPTDVSDWVLGQWTTAGNTNTYQNRIRVNRLIPCEPNTTYYFQCYKNCVFVIRTFKENKTFNSSVGMVYSTAKYTTDSNTHYLAITLIHETDSTSDLLVLLENNEIKPFICLDSETDKTYEPYKKPSIDLQDNFIAKIRDVEDELDVVSGKLTKRIGKIVLDGSESWTQAGTQFNGLYSAYISLTPMKKTSVFDDILSSHFKSQDFWVQEEGITKSAEPLNYDYVLLRLSNTKATTINELKAWLAENNVELYYVLAEPYEVQLGTTKIPLFEGVNNVKIVTNLEPSLTELDYYLR